MTAEMQLITDDQMKHCVELFAQGMSRQEVISCLIDDSEHLQQLEATDADLRNTLSDLLRSADPNSARFAVKKYGEHYNLHKDAIKEVLKNRYEIAIVRSIEFMSAEIEHLSQQVAELDDMLDSASNTTPIGTGEFLSTLTARNNATKRIGELSEKYLERLERAQRINSEL